MPIKRMVVACKANANGEPDLVFMNVLCTKRQYTDGYHYDMAEKYAEKKGYERPFVAIAEGDSGFTHIASAV